MPTYEYLCQSCGEPLEVVQKMTDPPETECPSCGGLLRKVFHPAGIMFKGSGFYATDNRSKPKPTPTDKSDKSGDTAAAAPAATGGGDAKKRDPVKPAGAGTATDSAGGKAKP